LIFSINLNIIDFNNNNKVGYICFIDRSQNKSVEGIYSNIDLNFLYEKVVSDKNFPVDDIYNPDENIAKNCFKSRALSFEYYINSDIILKHLNCKERQRVIYIFGDIGKIEDFDKDNEGEDVDDEEEDDDEDGNRKEDELHLIEVDGVILERENKKCVLDNNFFISDPVYKFGFFRNNQNERIEYFIDKYKKYEISQIQEREG
jgi:hypothetical protein